MLSGMDATQHIYNLGPADSLADERPSVADLQRARVHALRAGEMRRAAAYAALVERRGGGAPAGGRRSLKRLRRVPMIWAWGALRRQQFFRDASSCTGWRSRSIPTRPGTDES